MPRILLCKVYAVGGKGRTGIGRQKDRDPEAREEGQGEAREDEHTRGRAGPGSRSREGEHGGRVASQIAPHRARAGRRAEAWRWRREDEGMLKANLMHVVRPG